MNEARRVGRNFAFVTLSQVITQVLAFLVSLSVARNLGVAQYGLFVFGFAFPSWFLWLVSFELDTVVAIEVAADRSKAGSYLTAVTLLRIPLAVIAMVILWVSVALVIPDPFARTVTLILGVASILSSYASIYRTMFRAFERLEFAALVVVVERSVAAAAILLLLVFGGGLLEISLVYVLTALLATILALSILRSRFAWFTPRVEWATMVTILRKAVPFAVDAVATSFLYSTGPLLATVLASSTATGEFNAAFSLVLALLAPLSVYPIVVLPMLSRVYKESQGVITKVIHRSQKLFFMFGLPVALGGAFLAHSIVTFIYGLGFADAARSLEILMAALAAETVSVGLMTTLAATGHQKLNLSITVAETAVNVVLCVALIPWLGHVGAAVAFLAGELVMVILSRLAVRRFFGSLHLVDVVLRPAIAGVAMIAVLYVLPDVPLFAAIGVGASAYFLVLIAIGGITREDWRIATELARGVLVHGKGDSGGSAENTPSAR